MDLNDLRSWHTVILFSAFIGIVLWAWSSKSKKRFDEASQLPFQEKEHPINKNIKGEQHE